jgi:RHS repeat-associated protein
VFFVNVRVVEQFILEVTMAGTTVNPYRFGGQIGYRTDPSGRSYIRQRHLDTTKGRWISRDPAPITPTDYNFYWYAKNNPVEFVDPFGNMPMSIRNFPIPPRQFKSESEVDELQRSLKNRFGGVPFTSPYNPLGLQPNIPAQSVKPLYNIISPRWSFECCTFACKCLFPGRTSSDQLFNLECIEGCELLSKADCDIALKAISGMGAQRNLQYILWFVWQDCC